ncbi:MAG: PadR family transcriptional regulator [Candidatus Paceibacterota bacterium]|jgi:PadR family transcriptional regulator PadR|nr:PadR family transcriptional regulator [bacterium]
MKIEEQEKTIKNAQIQMRKGVLEFAILLLIAKGKIYASDILSKLKEANLVVVEGTIYPLLSRLKNSELVDYTWEESKSGPPRKYYIVTEKGITFLDRCDSQWKILETAICLFKSK